MSFFLSFVQVPFFCSVLAAEVVFKLKGRAGGDAAYKDSEKKRERERERERKRERKKEKRRERDRRN
jgi:hypothetical protein